jgi:hypothetical protein
MKYYAFGKLILIVIVLTGSLCLNSFAQEESKVEIKRVEDKKITSIGGKEHQSNIYGVEIGMDIPTALRTVFENANRKSGQEKPDAYKNEGKGNKDIRVLYKDLPKGELQIVFADGVYVKEIVLRYRNERNVDDLRLPFSATIGSSTSTIYNTSATQSGVEAPAVLDGNTDIVTFGKSKSKDIEKYSAKTTGNIDRSRGDLLDGTRYDDRYTIGFTDRQKLQRAWWRDEKRESGYSVRVYFVGKKLTKAGARFVPSIVQKSIVVTPGDEEKLRSRLVW